MTRRPNPQPYTLGLEFTNEQPLDYEDARSASREFAVQRQAARDMLQSAYAELAQAEAHYRRQRRLVRAKAVGDTAKARDEWVDAETAAEREDRDAATYKVKVIAERLQEVDATRASFHRLLEWSSKVNPNGDQAESYRPRAVA
jgi:multidrug efflux pump subunit AcrA (membrane-fusion protein)